VGGGPQEELEEAAYWAELVSTVQGSLLADDALFDTGEPWEVGEDLEDEVEHFFNAPEGRPAYVSVRAGGLNGSGVDVVGSLEDFERSNVRAMFDRAVAEQARPRTPACAPTCALLSKGRGGRRAQKKQDASDSAWRVEQGRELAESGAEWVRRREWEARAEEVEFFVGIERLINLATSEAYRRAEHARGRFGRRGHKVPWEVVEQRVEALMGEILREQERRAPSDVDRRRTVLPPPRRRGARGVRAVGGRAGAAGAERRAGSRQAGAAEVLRLPKARDGAGAGEEGGDEEAEADVMAQREAEADDLDQFLMGVIGLPTRATPREERERVVRVRLRDFNDKVEMLPPPPSY